MKCYFLFCTLNNDCSVLTWVIREFCANFIQKTSVTKKTHTTQDKDVPHNMGKSDLIRASDFNFLMVLGKGSFGKVSFNNHEKWLLYLASDCISTESINSRSYWRRERGPMSCTPSKSWRRTSLYRTTMWNAQWSRNVYSRSRANHLSWCNCILVFRRWYIQYFFARPKITYTLYTQLNSYDFTVIEYDLELVT